MKASEMTNEQIADAIESSFCASSSPFGAMMREAAARLRMPTPVDDDLLKMARDIDKLRRRLKAAEDALDSAWMYADKLPHQWPLPERVRTKMKNAIAAIRGEGGARSESETE